MEEGHILHIKNMVCDRCILVVKEILVRSGFTPLRVELGTAVVHEPLGSREREALRPRFEARGFELLDDRRLRLVERIRTSVIEWVHYSDEAPASNLSDFLRRRCGRDYSFLSKLFSQVCGVSIEKYCIAQKIERAKELLVYGELSVGEIADRLRYSSASHLSAQFRSQTGMSPSRFRQLREHGLRPLDKVEKI